MAWRSAGSGRSLPCRDAREGPGRCRIRHAPSLASWRRPSGATPASGTGWSAPGRWRSCGTGSPARAGRSQGRVSAPSPSVPDAEGIASVRASLSLGPTGEREGRPHTGRLEPSEQFHGLGFESSALDGHRQGDDAVDVRPVVRLLSEATHCANASAVTHRLSSALSHERPSGVSRGAPGPLIPA